MRLLRLTTLTFTPTQPEYRQNATFYCDEYAQFYNTPTFLNIDKIVSVYVSDHPEIEVCADGEEVHTISANTTAIKMDDGSVYHVESSIHAIIMVIEDPKFDKMKVVLR
jgi:hypothetical protein